MSSASNVTDRLTFIIFDRSLVKTALKSLDKIQFPASLSIFNASGNALESDSSNFSNLPDDLQYLYVFISY